MAFITKLNSYAEKGWIPEKIKHILEDFYACYTSTLRDHGIDTSAYDPLFSVYLDLIKEQIASPFSFPSYHQQIIEPFDYYTFGVEFIKPLVDISISSLKGLENLKEISSLLEKGQNVILLANHQIEADPQAISILLEKHYPKIGKEMIFVAGERVLTDPLATPVSMGRNLLCIYSKRYIDNPPEQKTAKQMHNKKTMQRMSELLSVGGKCIYVAPSGGRDRPNSQGIVEVAPFDPQSIEMFYLMAQRAGKPTHFYPLALATYDLLPPPQTIQIELGELRKTQRGGIHLSFGKQIDMEHFPGCEHSDKHARRQARADYIWNQVNNQYLQFPSAGANK